MKVIQSSILLAGVALGTVLMTPDAQAGSYSFCEARVWPYWSSEVDCTRTGRDGTYAQGEAQAVSYSSTRHRLKSTLSTGHRLWASAVDNNGNWVAGCDLTSTGTRYCNFTTPSSTNLSRVQVWVQNDSVTNWTWPRSVCEVNRWDGTYLYCATGVGNDSDGYRELSKGFGFGITSESTDTHWVGAYFQEGSGSLSAYALQYDGRFVHAAYANSNGNYYDYNDWVEADARLWPTALRVYSAY